MQCSLMCCSCYCPPCKNVLYVAQQYCCWIRTSRRHKRQDAEVVGDVVQGVTQGPCSISEFRGWMHDLRMDQQLSFQYKQFSEVSAWKVSHLEPFCISNMLCALC